VGKVKVPPGYKRQRLLQTGFAVPLFFSVILFVLFLPTLLQHFIFQMKKINSCPGAKKQRQKAVRSALPTHLRQKKNKVSYFT